MSAFTMRVVSRDPLHLTGTSPAGREWTYLSGPYRTATDRTRAASRSWHIEMDSLIIASGAGDPALPLAVALVAEALTQWEADAWT